MYKTISQHDIDCLIKQGCQAQDWNEVLVENDFTVTNIHNVTFTGKVYLGADVTLVNIQNLGSTGDTTFANGIEIGVLKEDGGKEVIIYDELSSMEAAFEVQEADCEPQLVASIRQKALDYAKELHSDGSIIESGVEVRDVRQLTDVHLTSGTQVVGATRLVNVSIISLPGAHSSIGDNVILENVIVCSDGYIGDAAQLDNCFVGQGCHIGRMFSATQSLFFANCHFENGEACAYFAGPYSVSHHKASLLIAFQSSFFNAGSGSNQSNHSYKMGPNKYGQLLRGAKMGSSSYLYWPMQIGVFSTVLGHHTGHQDLRSLPFSLVAESEGNTIVIPAQAFKSVGTRRDVQKWPKRDKRSDSQDGSTKRDIINFSLFNPYNLQYILEGISVLEDMQISGITEYNGAKVSERHIASALNLYDEALILYQAQILQKYTVEQIAQAESTCDDDRWADYGGFLCNRKNLINMLVQGKSFAEASLSVEYDELQWAASHLDFSDTDLILKEAAEIQMKWDKTLEEDSQCDLAMCNIDM